METIRDIFSLERFDRPWCLWLVLLAVLAWWLSRRSLAGLGPVRGALCLLARSIVIVLLVLALAGTHRILKNRDLNVLFVIDQSRSIPDEMRRQIETFIKKTTGEIKPDDRVSILTFDAQTNIEQLPSKPGPDGAIHVPLPLSEGSRPDRTNIAQAVRMASACALDSTTNRVVLFTDGNQNMGDVIEEARTAKANNIAVDVIPIRYEHGSEVVFERLRAPPYAHMDEQIPLRLILRAEKRTNGTIQVYQKAGAVEQPVDLSPETQGAGQRVTLEPGRNAFTVKVPIKAARAHEFRAEFVPDDRTADAIVNNNIARAFTNVEGPATVLFIGTERDRADDALLVEALQREQIDVEFESAESVSLESAELQNYSAVILSNVPADAFSNEQHQALANYVRDMGCGLVMIGGDDSFGAGGWQGSVVEDIMPVKFDVDAVKQIPRGALAIVMHSCEMPAGNKWGIETAVAALKTLSRLDYFGVVGWGISGFHWEVPMQVASNKDAITAKIRQMQNSDMFDFDTPMSMAVQALLNCKDAAQRHMIIISDGDPQPPSSGLINKMVGNRITCSTVLVFPHGGAEVNTMQNIAKKTKGEYYLLKNAGDEKRLPRIFTKEAKVVRRPLIRDEEFTPKVRPSLSDIMIGFEGGFPKLKGYVVTTPRKAVDVEMPLVTEKGDPLLAHWQVAFGRTVAFTSGRWKHWGADWPEWPSFSKLWSQAVRWCMRQGTAADYDVSTTVQGDRGHIVIETISEQEGFANFRQFVGRLIQPDGESRELSIVQTGPGKYEAEFDASNMGTYLVNIQAPGTAEERPASIRTGVTVAFSPEFKDLGVNDTVLSEILRAADGRMLDFNVESDTVFAHNLPAAISRKPIWNTLLQLFIFFFLLDVALRRIAFDPAKMAAYVRSHIASLAGRFGSGQRAEVVLTDLKGVREKVREERTAAGDTERLRSIRESAAASRLDDAASLDAGAKFDSGRKRATGDLAGTVGGAQQAPKPAPIADKAKDAGPVESTTARLLKARKKIKDSHDKEEPNA